MAKLTTQEVAKETGLTPERIAQLCRESAFPCEKVGRDWLISKTAITYIKGRKETRGRKKLVKNNFATAKELT